MSDADLRATSSGLIAAIYFAAPATPMALTQLRRTRLCAAVTAIMLAPAAAPMSNTELIRSSCIPCAIRFLTNALTRPNSRPCEKFVVAPYETDILSIS